MASARGVSIGGGGAAGAEVASALAEPAWRTEGLKQFRELQLKMTDVIGKQTMFDAQRTENELVKHELDSLKPDEHVYKFMGKVLVRQETGDAKSVVARRLDMIAGSLDGTEKQLADIRGEMGAIRKRLTEAGGGASASAAGASAGGGGAR